LIIKMKILTTFLTFLTASAVYANNINGLYRNYLYKRDNSTEVTIDPNEDACEAELTKYDCFPYEFYKNNVEQDCKRYTGSECQKIINDYQNYIPSCELSEGTVKFIKSIINVVCNSKDTTGNYCPLAETIFKEAGGKVVYYSYSEEKLNKENTCQSDSCRESTLDFYKNKASFFIDNSEKITSLDSPELAEIKGVIEYYDSKECKAMSSDATTLKIGSGLFISLGLLLLSLYY